MTLYRVLWIDDECDKSPSFVKMMRRGYDIEIVPFKYAEDGISALETHLDSWDGVILDAKMRYNEDDLKPNLTPMTSCIAKIFSLRSKKCLPYVISTTRTSLTQNEDFIEEHSGHIFQKPADDRKMAEYLVNEMKDSDNAKIRFHYEKMFSWYPRSTELLKIVKPIYNGKEDNPYLGTALRTELVWLFEQLRNYGFIHVPVTKTNIAECASQFDDDRVKEYVPGYIRRTFYSLSQTLNECSHELDSNIDIKEGNAPNLINQTLQEFITLAVWYHGLSNDKQEILDVSNYFQDICKVGVLEKDDNGLYHINGNEIKKWDGISKLIGKKCIARSIKVKELSDNPYKYLAHKCYLYE